MKKTILLWLFIPLLSACDLEEIPDGVTTTAVKFEIWFGNTGEIEENGNAVIELAEGGYVVVGYQEQAPNQNNEGLIIKFKADGDVVWNKRAKLGSYATFSAVQRTTDNGFVAVGTAYMSAAAQNDVFLCKFDQNGNLSYSKNIAGPLGADYGSDVLVLNDGFLILGNTTGNSDNQILVIKTDFNGNVLDSKTYGGAGEDRAVKFIKTQDNGYAIVGNTSSFGAGQNDMYLCKLSSTLALSWQKNFGTATEDNGSDLVEAKDGSFILVGQKANGNAPDIFIVKADKNGNKLWEKSYGTLFYDYGNGVALSSDGNILLCGTKGDNNDLRVFIMQLDEAGNQKWERLFSRFYGIDIKATKDGGIVVTGARNNPSDNEEDVYLIKTDKEGNVL
ncbi:MAG: hypothetical protein IPO07_29475 [Haliscomenobacter sp.]|nr:hypothetical protein [Haliscomenobacter sp.]MBK9492460.1 hypothetical protein [Haliscomenobacter sp.]